jgi:PTS system mannose-specific IIC component
MVTYAIVGALIAAIFVLGKGQAPKTSSASAGSAALEDDDDDDF